MEINPNECFVYCTGMNIWYLVFWGSVADLFIWYLVLGIWYFRFGAWFIYLVFGILEAVNFLHKLPICAESDIFLRYCAMDQEKNWYFDFQFGFWYFDFRARFIYLVFGIGQSADSFIWYLVLGLPNRYFVMKNTRCSCKYSIQFLDLIFNSLRLE